MGEWRDFGIAIMLFGQPSSSCPFSLSSSLLVFGHIGMELAGFLCLFEWFSTAEDLGLCAYYVGWTSVESGDLFERSLSPSSPSVVSTISRKSVLGSRQRQSSSI